jgi:23S rRNA A1618 N6-methylase RlmF
MKKYILFILVATVLMSFKKIEEKDKTSLLTRKWLMTSMQVEGNTITEEAQRKRGMQTILHFQKGGVCIVYVKTLKKKTTKRNKWQFEDGQRTLIIQADNEPPLKFKIEKLTSRKMTLLLQEEKTTQIFEYEAYKE